MEDFNGRAYRFQVGWGHVIRSKEPASATTMTTCSSLASRMRDHTGGLNDGHQIAADVMSRQTRTLSGQAAAPAEAAPARPAVSAARNGTARPGCPHSARPGAARRNCPRSTQPNGRTVTRAQRAPADGGTAAQHGPARPGSVEAAQHGRAETQAVATARRGPARCAAARARPGRPGAAARALCSTARRRPTVTRRPSAARPWLGLAIAPAPVPSGHGRRS